MIGEFMKLKCAPQITEHQGILDCSAEDETFLIQKARLGDNASFALLVARYREKLYRIIYWMTRHEEDTLDLLQDTFMNAYLSMHKLKDPGIFSRWITKIAVNLSINHIKRKQRIRKVQERLKYECEPFQKNHLPEKIVEQNELKDRLADLIDRLPGKQKSVFVLCDIEGYSYKETAAILQCNIGTVMSRLFYARTFIRERWDSELNHP